MIYWKTL